MSSSGHAAEGTGDNVPPRFVYHEALFVVTCNDLTAATERPWLDSKFSGAAHEDS